MKKILLVTSLLTVVLMVSGCDFFRRLAGRPTSEDIAAKKEILASATPAQQAESAEAKNASDSLAVMKALEENPRILVKANHLNLKKDSGLNTKFCVMTGTFGDPANADRLFAKATAAGYKGTLIHYANDLTAVGIGPTNSLVEAYKTLQKVLGEDFFSKESWIIDNR